VPGLITNLSAFQMSIYNHILNLLPFHKQQPEKPDSEKFMAQMELLLKEAHSQQLEQAKAAAADGTGPQSVGCRLVRERTGRGGGSPGSD